MPGRTGCGGGGWWRRRRKLWWVEGWLGGGFGSRGDTRWLSTASDLAADGSSTARSEATTTRGDPSGQQKQRGFKPPAAPAPLSPPPWKKTSSFSSPQSLPSLALLTCSQESSYWCPLRFIFVKIRSHYENSVMASW